MWDGRGGMEGKRWGAWVSHQAEGEPYAETGDSLACSGIWKRFGVARVCNGGKGGLVEHEIRLHNEVKAKSQLIL